MIEHVVFSGCGPNGLIEIGFAAELVRAGHLNAGNLKSVYGTSAGAAIAALLILGISMDEFGEYMIRRPWNKWFDVNLMQANELCGLLKWEKLKDMVGPLLKAHGVADSLTLKGVYDLTHIDFHIFTTELESFRAVDLNHASFPDLPLQLALCMSAAAFPIFSPILYQGKHYADGDFRNHFPMDELLKTNPDVDTVLGVNMAGQDDPYHPSMTAVETLFYIFRRSVADICTCHETHALGQTCKYYFGHCNVSAMGPNVWNSFFNDEEFRRQRMVEGTDLGKQFILEKLSS